MWHIIIVAISVATGEGGNNALVSKDGFATHDACEAAVGSKTIHKFVDKLQLIYSPKKGPLIAFVRADCIQDRSQEV